jgi:hypothetical protein
VVRLLVSSSNPYYPIPVKRETFGVVPKALVLLNAGIRVALFRSAYGSLDVLRCDGKPPLGEHIFELVFDPQALEM